MPAVNAVPFAIGMAFPSGPSAAGNVSATIILSPFAAMLDNEVSSNGPLVESIVETSDWSPLKAKAEVPLAIPAVPMGQGQSSKVAAAGDEALPETVVDVLTGSNPDDLRPVPAETILPEIAAAVVPIAHPLPGALVAASQPVDGGVPIALPRSTNARPAARPLKGGVNPSVISDLATVALQPAS